MAVAQAKCPKCGGQMDQGRIAPEVRVIKEGDFVGDRASALYCKRCGYVEFYKEASTKEPWRFSTALPQPQPQETQKEEESKQPEEPSRKPEKRLVR